MENLSAEFPEIVEPKVAMTLTNFLQSNRRYPVIAITGPSGVGKSTVTSLLANHLGARVYTEKPETNIFLKIISATEGKVSDIMLWNSNQNYFLSTDIGEITKGFLDSRNRPVIFDFALNQPFIYSDMKLSGNYLKVFNDSFELQFDAMPKPDIVIEVEAKNSVIVQRLADRGKHIDGFIVKNVEKNNSYFKSGIVEEMYSKHSKILKFDNNTHFPDKKKLRDKVLGLLN